MATTEDSMLRFSCPRCFIHLKAKREAAGSRCLCPRCQNFFEVPAKSRSDAPQEDYSLRQGGEPSSVEAVHVLVVCPVCHTRLYGNSDQVGERIECPDCGTPSVVPEPTPVEKKRYRSAEEIGDYGLSSEAGRRSGMVAAAEGHYVAVVCPVCDTRMHATVDRVGERMICPDCGSTAIVPKPPPAPIIHDPMEGAGEGYGVTQREPPAPKTLPPRRKKAAEVVDEDESDDERPEMPSLPFYSRTFTFPFGESARFYTVLLSAWAAMCFWLAYSSGRMTAVMEGKSMFGGAIFGAFALIISIMWFGYASTCALSVIRDTANGDDEVQDWPDAVFLDWVGHIFFIFNALAISLAPGALLVWLLSGGNLSGTAVGLIGAFFLFPLVLLSMLEKNSVFAAFSPVVWKTFFTSVETWTGFYPMSAVLLVAIVVVNRAAMYLGMILGGLVLGTTLAVGWMVYFRLLGRLGRICLEIARRRYVEYDDEEDEEDEDEDEEE